MSSGFIAQIVLEPYQMAILLTLSAYAMWAGRPEIPVGMYLSLALWTRTVMVGPLSHERFLQAVMIIAALRYMHQQLKMSLLPDLQHPERNLLGPPTERWIMPWMLLWWIWMLLLIALFDQELGKMVYLRPLIQNIMIPLPIILLFGHDLRRVKIFATFYVVTNLIGGYFAINLLGFTWDYLLIDPTLSNTQVVRLNLYNYHWFSYGFGISLILTVGLFLGTRGVLRSLLLLIAAGICAYFLMMAGSRQSLNASIAVVLLFTLWGMRRSGRLNVRAVTVIGVTFFIGITLFILAPQLIIRTSGNETSILDTINLVDDRSEIWEKGIAAFMSSPIWGLGFQFNSHNIFVGALADQGLVGTLMFIGVLVFILRQTTGILATDYPEDIAILQMTFFGIVIFALIHSQASGSTLSQFYIYWAGAGLWWLKHLATRDTHSALPQEKEARAGTELIVVTQNQPTRQHPMR